MMGAATAVFMMAALGAFVGYRVGYDRLYAKAKKAVFGDELGLIITEPILAELTDLGAVISNANNPTNAPYHDTFLVRPDEELGFVLRPNVVTKVCELRSRHPFDFSHAALHTNGPESEFSDALEGYIRRTNAGELHLHDRLARPSPNPAAGRVRPKDPHRW